MKLCKKRCLIRLQKGVSKTSKGHLFEGKRACIIFEMFEKSLQICLPVHSSTNLCSSVTLSFIRSNSSTCQPVYLSTNLCSSVTLSFITSNLSTCLTCLLVYSYYYIYLAWNRFFCVVPLHRHQE